MSRGALGLGSGGTVKGGRHLEGGGSEAGPQEVGEGRDMTMRKEEDLMREEGEAGCTRGLGSVL